MPPPKVTLKKGKRPNSDGVLFIILWFCIYLNKFVLCLLNDDSYNFVKYKNTYLPYVFNNTYIVLPMK